MRLVMLENREFCALVAEFGLATGMGNAHWNPDGYHHGLTKAKRPGQRNRI